MALTKKQIKDSYPLPVYNYRVTIGKDTLGFSEVSGLGVEYEPVTYKHGLSFVMGSKIIPGMRQPVKLTLKRGIIQESKNPTPMYDILQGGKTPKQSKGAFLANWLKETYANPLKNTKQDIFIDLCDGDGKAVVRWTVIGALPVKMDAPTFDANSNDVAIETLELVAHEIKIDYNPL